jgi:O-antigen/teichoic acid export membrane protein
MELYSRARARRALFHTVGLRAVSQVTTILSFVVLVRGLSEQSLGVYSLLYSVIPVIATVASLGLDQVLRRFQPEYLQAGNTAAAAWLVRSVIRLRLASNLVLLAAIIVAWNLVAPVFHLTDQRQNFALFSLVVLLYFQTIILQSSLASHMLQSYSVGSVALLSIGKLLSYLAVYEFLAFTLRAAIMADIVAYSLTYAFLSLAHWRNCRPKPADRAFRPDSAERKRLRRYAAANNFNDNSSLLLFVQTDNFFIAALMNPLAVGAYAFYARLNEMAGSLIPTRLFDNVLQPLFFSTKLEQAAERLPRYVTLLINICLMVQWPLFAYTLVYHRELIALVFHGKFIEYSVLLPVIIGFALTNNVISTPITMTALYAERASLILKSQLFGLYQIVAMFTLIPILGLYGAAIATGTLHLFRNLWVWWHVRATARWLNFRAAITTGTLIWAVAIGASMSLKLMLRAPAVVHLVTGSVICAGAFLVYARSPAISNSDREILGSVLHGRESVVLRWLGLAPTVAVGSGRLKDQTQ